MIGIGVPNGVVNLPTVHMVQTFKGNYVIGHTSFTPTVPLQDMYFGTFYFSSTVKAPMTATIPANLATRVRTGTGSYDRYPYVGSPAGTSIFHNSYYAELFPFDFDGVQGAIKAKGDEKWITFQGMYASTITFSTVAGDGYGGAAYSATESGFRNGRGTWRYKMNLEAGMANSLPLSGIAGIDKTVSTISDKYTSGGASSTFDNGGPHSNAQVTHKDGGFSVL